MRLFRPDLMIVQSLCTKQMFAIRGFNTKLLPLSGINSKKFSPASADFKYNLRKKYNINFNDFVLLHVGHIKSGRNIAIFKELKIKYNDISIIIVGSTSTQVDEDLLRELVSIGCIVYTKYFEDIEELYQLSDCYVFPTIDKLNSILLPLSILEAMSCNLPVVSTKFGILQEYFKEGEGLSFVDDDAQIISKVNLQRKRMNGISTREKIEIFSWEAIADNLEQVYYDIISGRIDD